MKAEYAAEYAAELELLNKRYESLGRELRKVQKRHDDLVAYFRVQKNRGKISDEEFRQLKGKRYVAVMRRGETANKCEFCRRKWDPRGSRYDNSTEVARGGRISLYYGVNELEELLYTQQLTMIRTRIIRSSARSAAGI